MRRHRTRAAKAHFEPLEVRRLLSTALVDIGPTYQAPMPDATGWSGSGNSAPLTFALPSGNGVTATLSGSALQWVDYSNTHPTTSPSQLMYRDGVYQAGNLTLAFSGLAAGTYTLTLSSLDEGAAGGSTVSTFDVQVTDATRTGTTVLSAQHTATLTSSGQAYPASAVPTNADLPPITFSPNADGTATIVLARTGTSGNVWLNGFRLADGVTVTDTTAPGPNAPAWSKAPYAVQEGVAGVAMVAAAETDPSGVQYYFENVADPTRNSGWVSAPSWSDLGLVGGATYQYRFKARDRSAAHNETGWSPVATVTTATDNAYAGFTPAEIGPRQPAFDFTGVRSIPHAPDAGVHPRIYTSPAELPDIRNNLATTASGQESMAEIDAYVRDLIYGNAGFNRSAPYAKDAYGTSRLGNIGFYDQSSYYAALLNYGGTGNPLPVNADGTPDTKTRNVLASELALDAYQTWVYQGQPEFDARAKDLATVLDNWAKLEQGDAALSGNSGYTNLGGEQFAEAYDFAYNAMNAAQRGDVESVLARTLATASQIYGTNVAPIATTSNWSSLNDFQAVAMMALEGEGGYNAADFRSFMRVEYNFVTYGWYSDGAPNEGLGKNYQMLGIMAAFARRDYDLIGHPNVRAFATNYLPHMLQPYGDAFSEYDDWGGTGSSGSPTGGYKFNPQDAIGLKYLFPTSAAADFVYQNYMGRAGDANPYAAYHAGIPPAGLNDPLLVGSIEAADFDAANLPAVSPANYQAANRSAQQNQLTFFEPNRGLVVSRSDFSKDALELQFQSRQDLGGHTHADRNVFTLSALGRTWAVYRSLGSGGANGTIGDSKYHSVELVGDGTTDLGMGIDGDVSKAPGKIDEVDDTSAGMFVAGDAKYAYDWTFHGDPSQTRASLPPGVLPADESLNDFRLQKDTTDAWYNDPLFDRPFWDGPATAYEGFEKVPYNPMQSAYRTVSLVRGPQPYALVMDDYQKDAASHTYDWLMQLPDDVSIDPNAATVDPNPYANDIVLKEANGNRRLLVRILNANGLTSAAIDTVQQPNSGTWQRLVVKATSVNPQFRIMLLPFTAGDALPTTTVSNGQIVNAFADGHTDSITFQPGADGRTRYALAQSTGGSATEATDTAAPAAPTNLTVAVRSQTTAVLNWTDPGATAQVYKIQRSTDGVHFTDVNTTLVGVTTYTDQTLTAGVTYTYRVLAANTLASAPSNTATVTAWPASTVIVRPGAQAYTQNFDVLQYKLASNVAWGGDAWLPGWSLSRTDGTTVTRTDAGTETFPRAFSEGTSNASTDRAFGGMANGNGAQAEGVLFQNALGTAVTSVDLSYLVEQWRANVNGGALKLYYKVQASNPTFDLAGSTSGWSSVTALDFAAVTAATGTPLDGHAPANSANESTHLSLNVPAGQYLWLAWRITGGSNNNNPSLAIDNLSVVMNDAAPTIATPAAANPSIVTGTSANLSVVGADDKGEPNLTYTWAATAVPAGAPSPTFSGNGSNAAKSTIVTFGQAGAYTFQVTATDQSGRSAASGVAVTVNATPSGVQITPANPTLPIYNTLQMAAAAVDQFGNPLAQQPASFTWSAAGGTVNASGLFTAPATPGSTTITAAANGLTGSRALSIVPPPTFQLDMSSVNNTCGYYLDGTTFPSSGGVTRQGQALPAAQIPSSLSFDGVTFAMLPGNTTNTYLSGSRITTLPLGHYTDLLLLGLCSNTTQTSPFVVYYADGTTQTINQGLSRWTQPSNYAGETTLLTAAYQVNYNGTTTAGNRYLYGYDLKLDSTKAISSIRWPNSGNDVFLGTALTWQAPAAAPVAQAFTVNGGAAQRSQVTSLAVTFNQPVTLAAGAITLALRSATGGAAAPVTGFTLASPDGGTTYVVSFPSAAGFTAGSLADGVYDLVVHGLLVQASAGGGGSGLTDRTYTFHRLFGDANGDAVVNNYDYLVFSKAFGTSSGAAGYDPAFDFNGDGLINNYDYLQFSNRYGTGLTYTP